MKTSAIFSALGALLLLNGCGGSGNNSTPTTARYTITELGINYGSSRALGLNNLGQVVGEAIPPYAPHPTGGVIEGIPSSFLYANDRITDLKPPELSAINDNGQIVGSSGLYQNNALTPIPSLYSAAVVGDPDSTNATAINNQGQIVGSSLAGPPSANCRRGDGRGWKPARRAVAKRKFAGCGDFRPGAWSQQRGANCGQHGRCGKRSRREYSQVPRPLIVLRQSDTCIDAPHHFLLLGIVSLPSTAGVVARHATG